MPCRLIHSLWPFLVLLALLPACKDEPEPPLKHLSFISRVQLNVHEASGLAVFSQEMFLTVSDSVSKIYLVDLNGKVVATLGFSGKNLEGVAYDPAGPFIYVVEENDNQVVRMDTAGKELGRFHVPLDNADPRHGLEGITHNPKNGRLYVVSEKDPALLFELSATGELIDTHPLDFAKDYSSVFYDAHEDVLWILSDDSGTLTKTTLKGEALATYLTGVEKGEGVIVDSKASRVYIVTDTDSSLFTLGF